VLLLLLELLIRDGWCVLLVERVEEPVLRVAVAVLVERVEVGALVVRVAVPDVLAGPTEPVERVEPPVLRVAVAVVERPDVGALVVRVAVAVPAVLAGPAAVEVEREELPERLTASERVAAVCVLP